MQTVDLDPLSGIRGMASLSIVVGHALTLFMPESGIPPYIPYIIAVTVFFVVSGYTLTLLYGCSDPDDGSLPPLLRTDPPGSVRRFTIKRMARILPLYYLGAVLALPVFFGLGPSLAEALSGVLGVSLFLQTLALQGLWLDAPLWQVSTFFWAYLLFPRLLRYVRGKTTPQLQRLMHVLWLVPAALAVAALILYVPLFGVLHFVLPMRLPQFVAGMIAALQVSREAVPASLNEPVLTACLAVVWLALLIGSIIGHSFYWPMCLEMTGQFVLLPLIVRWIQALTLSPSKLMRRFLCSAPMLFLGRISYAVYVLHFPIFRAATMLYAKSWLDTKKRRDIQGYYALPMWSLPVMLAIIIAISTVAHYLVESPCRRYIVARWASKKSTPLADGYRPLDNTSKA